MVQSTFTRQKRELAKAASWIEKLRAQEVRIVRFDAAGNKLTETRETYVDNAPEEVARKVIEIVAEVVQQHGARQQANGKNTGTFRWRSIDVQLSVPQLRALHEAYITLSTLVQRLPRRNPKVVHNSVIEGRPAFADKVLEDIEQRTRYVPFEEDTSTRVRSYEEHYREKTGASQRIEIDFGIEIKRLQALEEMVTDLGTSIQVAIDEANGKPHAEDPVLREVIRAICGELDAALPQTPASDLQSAATKRP